MVEYNRSHQHNNIIAIKEPATTTTYGTAVQQHNQCWQHNIHNNLTAQQQNNEQPNNWNITSK
jgi:hypothetical protein